MVIDKQEIINEYGRHIGDTGSPCDQGCHQDGRRQGVAAAGHVTARPRHRQYFVASPASRQLHVNGTERGELGGSERAYPRGGPLQGCPLLHRNGPKRRLEVGRPVPQLAVVAVQLAGVAAQGRLPALAHGLHDGTDGHLA